MRISSPAGVSEMQLLTNELSIHKQFHDMNSFRSAIHTLMEIRSVAREFDTEMYCSRKLLDTRLNDSMTMQQGVALLELNQRRALMQWLTRNGPFWEEIRHHKEDEWLEHNDEIVTDNAIGEAAWASYIGIEEEIVSISPSKWEFTPLRITWKREDESVDLPPVNNYWKPQPLRAALSQKTPPIKSWSRLSTTARAKFTELTFLEDSFSYLDGCPFSPNAAKRILSILEILNKMKKCFDPNGARTPEGHELYKNFFTGKKEEGGRGALFSDSSDTEKNKYRNKMTFSHPAAAGESLFCPFHGKVQTPHLRIHFSYPITCSEPLYIVYIGPKITV